ncbi:SRPBCC family protein [Thermomonospora umbrina]|uniref:Polyketide cyclase/dehydrase/lipid transport protein n=1 Tax=Thermomonospora umbrina TaxID=111806 RepID=A0A3D9SRH0_9ACTN|nr:SRPBCC family protein [Thermomonospora umbrina]REE98408.1 polyketide cyclase/dehydrase/lipid transport protein [Thermomonospora umbrina]
MRCHYSISKSLAGPPETAFGLLADVDRWSSWAKPLIFTSRWDGRGGGAPGGVGAVRVTGIWPFLIREEITDLQPPHRMSYRYVGRLIPVWNYHATVSLTPGPEGGTDVRWTASGTTIPPVMWIVRLTVVTLLWLLARACRTRHQPVPS